MRLSICIEADGLYTIPITIRAIQIYEKMKFLYMIFGDKKYRSGLWAVSRNRYTTGSDLQKD